MSLVPSLLQAIVNVDGEALVIHAGDKPYVVSPTGQVELATRGLTLEAVSGIVNQLLPVEFQNALDEFGAVQYELPPQDEFPHEHFTVVAARGGDDVWAEVRRRRIPDEDMVPDDVFGAPPSMGQVDAPSLDNDDAIGIDDFDDETAPEPVAAPPAVASRPMAVVTNVVGDDLSIDDDAFLLPKADQLWPGEGADTEAAEIHTAVPVASATHEDELNEEEIEIELPAAAPVAPPVVMPPAAPVHVAPAPSHQAPQHQAPAKAPAKPPATVPPIAATVAPSPKAPAPGRQAPGTAPGTAPGHQAPRHPAPVPQPAVVLPIARNPIRMDAPPPPPAGDTLSGLERLLRVAAARGASTLYVSSGERPSVRVDGELQSIDGEPVLSSHDVVSLLLTLMPDRAHEALRTGAPTEWISDIEDVGRVRCVSFGDHRGPGGVFRLMPARVATAEQLGLSAEIQRLAIEPEGLILAVGSRSSGKRTLVASLVDLINRTRRDHLITIEREVSIVQPRGNSFISQREVRGGDEELLTAARAALREDPDVLVIEQIRTGAMMNVALEAASSGHLVIAGFSAHSATAAVDRIIDLYAPEHARQVQLALADNLRGIVAQVLLKRIGGGRVAAREVLLNTPAVSGVIAEGKTSQLPMAIEGGRRHGMMPLNEAVAALVQSGAVDPGEGYRHVTDRTAYLSLLKRQGQDTSFAERLA